MALLVQWKISSTTYLILQVLVQKVSAGILSRRGSPQILCGAYCHQPHYVYWCSCVWEVSQPNFWSLCIHVSQVRLMHLFLPKKVLMLLLNSIPYRWLIGLQSSSRDLEFSQPIACLLQRSLHAVFIGKCFAFNFRHPYGVSSDTNLIASGIKPLGSINSSTNVITLLKRHFDQRKTFPSVDLHLVPPKRKSTTPSQSVALTCGKAHNTIHCSQRNSFLYESVHVSTSQVPHEVHFESYCNESSLSTSFLNSPRASSCVNNCPALLDATFKAAPQVKPALSVTPSLSSTHVPVTVTEYCEEQEPFTDDSEEGEEATMTNSEAVEILHELISDWESSQITVDENSTASSEVEGALGRTDLDSLHHNTRATRDSQYSLEDCSFCDQQPDGSLLCLSEAVIAELQSSFNRSANFTPFCSTKLRRSSSSVGSATSLPLASAMSYESPELFSSASSLASVTQRFGRSNPKQSQSNLLTEVSPELFGSSKPTLPATLHPPSPFTFSCPPPPTVTLHLLLSPSTHCHPPPSLSCPPPPTITLHLTSPVPLHPLLQLSYSSSSTTSNTLSSTFSFGTLLFYIS